MIPSLLGISVVLFAILALAPGDPFEELATNPFLRADQPSVQQAVGVPGDAVATFAEIRRRKDHF